MLQEPQQRAGAPGLRTPESRKPAGAAARTSSSAVLGTAAARSVAAAASAEPAVESTEFKVTLEEAPADKKIGIIKVVREVTGLGLKEAKDLVDGAPKAIKEGVDKATSEEIKTKLADAGADVEIE